MQNLCNIRIKLEEDLRMELGRLPATLADLYTRILEQKRDLPLPSYLVFQSCLKWLLCQKLSLPAEEFLRAITFGEPTYISN